MEATRLNASINETQTHFIYVIGGKNKGFVNDENEGLEDASRNGKNQHWTRGS